MIDVMFILVVFFIVFTTFRTDPVGIEVNLPRRPPGPPTSRPSCG